MTAIKTITLSGLWVNQLSQAMTGKLEKICVEPTPRTENITFKRLRLSLRLFFATGSIGIRKQAMKKHRIYVFTHFCEGSANSC